MRRGNVGWKCRKENSGDDKLERKQPKDCPNFLSRRKKIQRKIHHRIKTEIEQGKERQERETLFELQLRDKYGAFYSRNKVTETIEHVKFYNKKRGNADELGAAHLRSN